MSSLLAVSGTLELELTSSEWPGGLACSCPFIRSWLESPCLSLCLAVEQVVFFPRTSILVLSETGNCRDEGVLEAQLGRGTVERCRGCLSASGDSEEPSLSELPDVLRRLD